jgi:hypothetical protein
MNKEQKGKIDLFLDSGAFSAFTQGVSIDIQEYIQFIKENLQYLTVYANLDVIGSPEGTYRNQLLMEEKGLKPLPCFHYGEDPKWLLRYMKSHDYIALGGMVPIANIALQQWLDEIFSNFICGPDGIPKVKVHGFGMTSHDLLWRYPWYSVDSTSWVVTGRLGGVYVPRISRGKYDYRQSPLKVQLSSRSPSAKEEGKHFSTFSPMEQAQIREYFQKKGFVIGKSSFRKEHPDYELQPGERWHGKAKNGKRELELVEEVGLANAYQERDKLNIMYFLDLEAAMPEWPWSFRLTKGKGGFGL